MSHIARCSCPIQTWLTGWSKRHRKDQNCCINQCGGGSNYPKLMLYYTNTWKYCGKEANLQVTVVLCLPTWMRYCFPGHGSHWAKVRHGGNLRASEANKNSSGGADSPLGHSQQFCKERQKGMKDWREVWSMLALMHATFLSRSDVGEWGCCKPWIYLQPGVDLLHRWHWIRIFLQTQVL